MKLSYTRHYCAAPFALNFFISNCMISTSSCTSFGFFHMYYVAAGCGTVRAFNKGKVYIILNA